jgi:hypothetical protein
LGGEEGKDQETSSNSDTELLKDMAKLVRFLWSH